jgi:metallo-beta-lactamase family protein
LGAILRDYPSTIKLFGKELKVRANIRIIDGLSGHADQNEMLRFLKNQSQVLLKQTFLVHGEYDRQVKFKDALTNAGYQNVMIPELGQEVSIP